MSQKIIQKANASLKFRYRKKMILNQYCMQENCLYGNDSVENRLRQQFILPQSTETRLQVIQNKMIRNVSNDSNRTHLVANDFNEVKWMSIENRILLNILPHAMYLTALIDWLHSTFKFLKE